MSFFFKYLNSVFSCSNTLRRYNYPSQILSNQGNFYLSISFIYLFLIIEKASQCIIIIIIIENFGVNVNTRVETAVYI